MLSSKSYITYLSQMNRTAQTNSSTLTLAPLLVPSLWTAAYLPSVSMMLMMTECGWMLLGAQV